MQRSAPLLIAEHEALMADVDDEDDTYDHDDYDVD
jgi:hypothetical protein